MSLFEFEDIEDIIICGGSFRFRVEYDTSDRLVCIYDGKHFYADASYGQSFVIHKDLLHPIRVRSNTHLGYLIGQSIN